MKTIRAIRTAPAGVISRKKQPDPPATASRGVPAPMSWRISNDRLCGDLKQVSFVHVLASAQPGSAHAAAIEVMGKRALYDLGAQLESREGDTRFEPHAVVGDRPTRCLVTTPARKIGLFGLTDPGLPGTIVQVFQGLLSRSFKTARA